MVKAWMKNCSILQIFTFNNQWLWNPEIQWPHTEINLKIKSQIWGFFFFNDFIHLFDREGTLAGEVGEGEEAGFPLRRDPVMGLHDNSNPVEISHSWILTCIIVYKGNMPPFLEFSWAEGREKLKTERGCYRLVDNSFKKIAEETYIQGSFRVQQGK